MSAMSYEDALRYVFDRCGRGGGPDHLAEADVFRGGRRDQYARVRRGLGLALERVRDDAEGIDWSDEEGARGGLQANFEGPLQTAIDRLSEDMSDENVLEVMSKLVHALKSLTLKARGTKPAAYEGEL